MRHIVIIIYFVTVSGLALYGLLGLLTLVLYWRHRHDTFPCPPFPSDPPTVTVQLPTYNERFVVQRLIEAAVSLNYPRHKLQIQVVDDSTDETTAIARQLVAQHRQQGVDMMLVHRTERSGYKAGALANALHSATGEFVAIFDADFQPNPNFLHQTIPHFLENDRLGMIQTRWGHLNHAESPLTAAQAIALDKHFAMEQTVRHRANLFPKFNGAGGVWRRTCLDDAGGWEADTVCEDLCLSTRAILRDWHFRFLNDVVSPAELPTSMAAYKNQQARWAKGSSQCLFKFGRPILTAVNQTRTARLYALLTMSAYSTHFLVLTLLLLQIPLLLLGVHFSPRMFIFSLAGLGQPLLFLLAQQALYSDWRQRLRHFPTMLLVAVGIGPSTSRAILEIFFRRQHAFVRTPKGDKRPFASPYRLPFDWIVVVELLLCAYAVTGIVLALHVGNLAPVFFLLTCASGMGYVAYLSLRELIG